MQRAEDETKKTKRKFKKAYFHRNQERREFLKFVNFQSIKFFLKASKNEIKKKYWIEHPEGN